MMIYLFSASNKSMQLALGNYFYHNGDIICVHHTRRFLYSIQDLSYVSDTNYYDIPKYKPIYCDINRFETLNNKLDLHITKIIYEKLHTFMSS